MGKSLDHHLEFQREYTAKQQKHYFVDFGQSRGRIRPGELHHSIRRKILHKYSDFHFFEIFHFLTFCITLGCFCTFFANQVVNHAPLWNIIIST